MHEREEPDQVAVARVTDTDVKAGSLPDTGKQAPQSQAQTGNPVSRARILVEMEVPESQRGPGWDRHWRELEAYVEARGHWSNKPE